MTKTRSSLLPMTAALALTLIVNVPTSADPTTTPNQNWLSPATVLAVTTQRQPRNTRNTRKLHGGETALGLVGIESLLSECVPPAKYVREALFFRVISCVQWFLNFMDTA